MNQHTIVKINRTVRVLTFLTALALAGALAMGIKTILLAG